MTRRETHVLKTVGRASILLLMNVVNIADSFELVFNPFFRLSSFLELQALSLYL